MPTTPNYALPYPALSDQPHGPNQLAALASAMDTVLASVQASDAANFAKLFNFSGAEVATPQTTTSTTYVDLATPGPTVALTSLGSKALCIWGAQMDNATPANGAGAAIDVSGATTIAASDAHVLGTNVGGTGFGFSACQFAFLTITPGLNTYKVKYRVAGATTGTFGKRRLFVWAP